MAGCWPPIGQAETPEHAVHFRAQPIHFGKGIARPTPIRHIERVENVAAERSQ